MFAKVVMAGRVSAIDVLDALRKARRGCPATSAGMTRWMGRRCL